MSRRRLFLVAGALAAVLLAAAVAALVYGGDETKPAALPLCARPARTVVPPAPFPARFPVPHGTVFVAAERLPGGFLVVTGRTPLELPRAARFFVRELPASGYALGAGDSEQGREAESDFSGHHVRGRFKVRVLPGCHGAVLLYVSVLRT